MSKHGSPSALLIISAIDLLLASLVCGVVLFVALVGARGHLSKEEIGAHAQARIPVTILYREELLPGDQASVIRVLDAKRIGVPEKAEEADIPDSGFEFTTEQTDSFRWASFLVRPDSARITISHVPLEAYVAIHLGTEGSYYISMRCNERDWELTLLLKPLRVVAESCRERSTGWIGRAGRDSGRTPPKPVFIVSSGVPPSDDWQRVASLPDGTGTVSRWLGQIDEIPDAVSTAIFRY